MAKTCSIGLRSGAVGRQEEQPGPGGADCATDGLAFVASQIVHNDDVAGRQGGDEELLDIGGEALAVDGAVDDAGGVDPVAPEGGKEG